MKSGKELKEGCGKEYDFNIKISLGLQKMKICGASGLCPICKAKLKILQKRNTEVKQAIIDWGLKNKLIEKDNKGDLHYEESICELLQKLGLGK